MNRHPHRHSNSTKQWSNTLGQAFEGLVVSTSKADEDTLYDEELKRLQQSRVEHELKMRESQSRLALWKRTKDHEFKERQKRRGGGE